MSDKSEEGRRVSPVIGVILMVAITVILAAVIAGFVIGMSGNITIARFPFEMTVNDSQTDQIEVFVTNTTTQQPLSNAQIAIYTYDTSTLLAGPLNTTDSGIILFERLDGFPDHYLHPLEPDRGFGNLNGLLDAGQFFRVLDRS